MELLNEGFQAFRGGLAVCALLQGAGQNLLAVALPILLQTLNDGLRVGLCRVVEHAKLVKLAVAAHVLQLPLQRDDVDGPCHIALGGVERFYNAGFLRVCHHRKNDRNIAQGRVRVGVLHRTRYRQCDGRAPCVDQVG